MNRRWRRGVERSRRNPITRRGGASSNFRKPRRKHRRAGAISEMGGISVNALLEDCERRAISPGISIFARPAREIPFPRQSPRGVPRQFPPGRPQKTPGNPHPPPFSPPGASGGPAGGGEGIYRPAPISPGSAQIGPTLLGNPPVLGELPVVPRRRNSRGGT